MPADRNAAEPPRVYAAGDFSWMEDERYGGKKSLWTRVKEDPLVPLGCAATTIVLLGGLMTFQRGQSKLGNKFMQARVVAQTATVFALAGGAANKKKKKKKEKKEKKENNIIGMVDTIETTCVTMARDELASLTDLEETQSFPAFIVALTAMNGYLRSKCSSEQQLLNELAKLLGAKDVASRKMADVLRALTFFYTSAARGSRIPQSLLSGLCSLLPQLKDKKEMLLLKDEHQRIARIALCLLARLIDQFEIQREMAARLTDSQKLSQEQSVDPSEQVLSSFLVTLETAVTTPTGLLLPRQRASLRVYAQLCRVFRKREQLVTYATTLLQQSSVLAENAVDAKGKKVAPPGPAQFGAVAGACHALRFHTVQDEQVFAVDKLVQLAFTMPSGTASRHAAKTLLSLLTSSSLNEDRPSNAVTTAKAIELYLLKARPRTLLGGDSLTSVYLLRLCGQMYRLPVHQQQQQQLGTSLSTQQSTENPALEVFFVSNALSAQLQEYLADVVQDAVTDGMVPPAVLLVAIEEVLRGTSPETSFRKQPNRGSACIFELEAAALLSLLPTPAKPVSSTVTLHRVCRAVQFVAERLDTNVLQLVASSFVTTSDFTISDFNAPAQSSFNADSWSGNGVTDEQSAFESWGDGNISQPTFTADDSAFESAFTSWPEPQLSSGLNDTPTKLTPETTTAPSTDALTDFSNWNQFKASAVATEFEAVITSSLENRSPTANCFEDESSGKAFDDSVVAEETKFEATEFEATEFEAGITSSPENPPSTANCFEDESSGKAFDSIVAEETKFEATAFEETEFKATEFDASINSSPENPPSTANCFEDESCGKAFDDSVVAEETEFKAAEFEATEFEATEFEATEFEAGINSSPENPPSTANCFEDESCGKAFDDSVVAEETESKAAEFEATEFEATEFEAGITSSPEKNPPSTANCFEDESSGKAFNDSVVAEETEFKAAEFEATEFEATGFEAGITSSPENPPSTANCLEDESSGKAFDDSVVAEETEFEAVITSSENPSANAGFDDEFDEIFGDAPVNAVDTASTIHEGAIGSPEVAAQQDKYDEEFDDIFGNAGQGQTNSDTAASNTSPSIDNTDNEAITIKHNTTGDEDQTVSGVEVRTGTRASDFSFR
ncbi:hypothetical protein PR001_g8162 [Phytophthora rubi]|uniref:HIG1 domain-containing protein n=1 Tax=Phytophthora rubi TaxID=129364 RepID=A0A6A3N2S9_9STRA|nr:hypothetical protein PR001_g8162 [Phytophthora rubi]